MSVWPRFAYSERGAYSQAIECDGNVRLPGVVPLCADLLTRHRSILVAMYKQQDQNMPACDQQMSVPAEASAK